MVFCVQHDLEGRPNLVAHLLHGLVASLQETMILENPLNLFVEDLALDYPDLPHRVQRDALPHELEGLVLPVDNGINRHRLESHQRKLVKLR